MGSKAKWRGKRKESVNWKVEQKKLPNLNTTKKMNCKTTTKTELQGHRTVTKHLTFAYPQWTGRKREKEDKKYVEK